MTKQNEVKGMLSFVDHDYADNMGFLPQETSI